MAKGLDVERRLMKKGRKGGRERKKKCEKQEILGPQRQRVSKDRSTSSESRESISWTKGTHSICIRRMQHKYFRAEKYSFDYFQNGFTIKNFFFRFWIFISGVKKHYFLVLDSHKGVNCLRTSSLLLYSLRNGFSCEIFSSFWYKIYSKFKILI